MKPERRTISIPRGAKIGSDQRPIYGLETMPADCAGGLAVHKALPGHRWRWMVSHESSGLCLDRIGAMTKARALENMQAALALPFDWTRGESETLAALRTSRGIVDAITSIGQRA